MSWPQADQERRIAGLVRIGHVIDVDPAQALARVSLGGAAETDWLPWTAARAGVISDWAPLQVGEQVVVASPGGESNQGVIIGSLFSAANGQAATDGGTWRVELGGTSLTMTADSLTFESNGSTLVLDSAGVRVTGAAIELN
ncbi:phage baseplate assembly protein V [Roseovarius ramblicola]|uniref:Phage baseplate assembly protein V n=1 Tax=Roseovarius ramblicola TaxID=2022336 RepID=A0ABV5I0Q5_9RHOB